MKLDMPFGSFLEIKQSGDIYEIYWETHRLPYTSTTEVIAHVFALGMQCGAFAVEHTMIRRRACQEKESDISE